MLGDSIREALDLVPAETLDALAITGFGSWTLGEKIYFTNNRPSSDRTDCYAAVRLARGQ